MKSSVARAVESVVLAAALAASSRLAAAPPWETPFSGDPAAILKAATVSPDRESGSIVLLEEGIFSFDERGRLTHRLRYVVRIVTPAAVDDWSGLETKWAPWHQDRPALRARVIAADGTVHELDPKTISDAPAAEYDPDLYSDRRVVRAPLPAVAPGAVIEEEITVRDREPAFPAGTVHRFFFGGGASTESTRLVLRFPQFLPLRTWLSPRLEVAPRRTEEEGTVTLVFEAGRLEPLDDFETGAPSDVPQGRFVKFSTGESWNAVARRYGEIVDGQLGSAGRVAPRPPADRDETIRQVLARLQREIRYTGVEFSEASIVPRTPAETAKRGYGDCKDKAALLVARLREAGIPAFVALLDTGFGFDVRPELPGLAFDHAIVQVRGPRPLWIDPTDEFAGPDQLPAADQGRLALVADAATTELVRTPESTSAQNRRIETREFRLQDDGPARLVEIREATGSRERDERARFAGGDRKVLQEAMEAYAREEFLSKGAVRYEISDPHDLVHSFRVRIEADRAGRGVTVDEEAGVALFPANLFRRLPYALRYAPQTEEEIEGGAAVKRKAERARPRVRDFLLGEPFTEGWRYRVVPPAGYVPGELPESSETAVGTGKLLQSYRSEPDGSITATIVFDSGKRRLTPAEFESYRKAVTELSKKPAVFLRFVQAGMAHLQAGRIREALAEFRRLAAQRPKNAVHHSQIALALLQGGLGEAARQEARRAVEIEPGSARAHRTLGWVLQHDLLGRRFSPGFDRAGSLSAYRKAKELDPKDAAGRADLAILLEHDEEGVRYGPSADLAGAIAEYQAIRKDLKESAYDVNLLICLCQTRRFDELVETVKGMDRSDIGDEWLVLSAAARGGVDDARREALRLIPDATRRRDALERIAQTLIQLRIYPEAAALLSDAADGSPKAATLRARADLMGRTRRWDAEPLPEGDPRSVAKRFYAAVVRGRIEDAASLFAKELAAEFSVKKNRDEMRQYLRVLRKSMGASGLPRDTMVDVLVAAVQMSVDGTDAQGYRVRIRAASPGGTVDHDLYLLREAGSLKIYSSDFAPGALGEEALRRARDSDDAAARLWLDWARERVHGDGGEDPLAGSPFARLWTRGVAAEPGRIRLAALALAAEGSHPARYVEELAKAREAEPGREERRAADMALARAYLREKRYVDLLSLATTLEAGAPASDAAFMLRQTALVQLGRLPDARRHAEDRLARRSDDPLAIRSLVELAYRSGDLGGGERLLRRLVEKGVATAGDYNELAWGTLFTGNVDARAVEEGQRAVEMTRSSSYAILHTLAAIYAETGRTTEARELILKAMDVSGREEPASADWYVLGRLAEQYGETGAAVESYRKVSPPERGEPLPVSTWTLAQARLKLLGASSPARGRSRD
jgi:tetratricopeptide (TPR) repeat protein